MSPEIQKLIASGITAAGVAGATAIYSHVQQAAQCSPPAEVRYTEERPTVPLCVQPEFKTVVKSTGSESPLAAPEVDLRQGW
jgi:hypothetical protein